MTPRSGSRTLTHQPLRQSWFVCVLLLALSGLAVGCQPKTEKSSTGKPTEIKPKGEPSVYRQAIDQAKALEKKINDRAIDPGEKARLGGPDPTGQDQ